MSFIALEISVNGERLYTVGAEDWRSLTAHVWGHRFTPDSFTRENWPEDEDLPNADIQRIDLQASVSVPNETDSAATDPSGGRLQAGTFDVKNLAVGDVVTIKVIESDFGDEPTWRNPDDGTIAIRSND